MLYLCLFFYRNFPFSFTEFLSSPTTLVLFHPSICPITHLSSHLPIYLPILSCISVLFCSGDALHDYTDFIYLGTCDGSEWRELLTQFLVIYGVVQVLNVQIYTLKGNDQPLRFVENNILSTKNI